MVHTEMKKAWFCDNWKSTREVLDFMATGASSFWVRLACKIVITGGDALSKEFCK